MARAASWDTDLEEKIGDAMGIEARAQGANFFGGICINLLRHPAWGRAQETFGEDPYLLGEMGAASVRGSQKHVMSCVKHFAANSIENSRFKVNVSMSDRVLREVYLPHFNRCVDEDVASVMSAYNKLNGKYCGHNPVLLRDILKNEWDFQGFVISDFIYGIYDAEKAIEGGLDVEMPFSLHINVGDVKNLVEEGKISAELIDDSVSRILREKFKFNIERRNGSYPKSKIACRKHRELALESARKGTVLLKNENDFLPLDVDELDKIAVIGSLGDEPNTGDRGSSRVNPPYVTTPLEGVEEIADGEAKVVFDKGENIRSARSIASNADAVIIVVGYTHEDEGEYFLFMGGGDRESLRLNSSDEELIKGVAEVNSNCVVILETGSAIVMEEWRNEVPSILVAWYPGMEGGRALGEIAFGEVCPSGKLPVTFPKSREQLPYFDNEIEEIDYGLYHGYWLVDKEGFEPAYHFGYGLSYTDFEYSNLEVDGDTFTEGEEVKSKIKVKNIGKRSGDEILQLYTGKEGSEISRPVKKLRDFARVHLDPGESKSITLGFSTDDLSYYDEERKMWSLEKGQYSIKVGPSSVPEDLLEEKIEVK